ncbi:MAG: hypothetical protein ACO3JL_01965 [Myxococcota bacterium]
MEADTMAQSQPAQDDPHAPSHLWSVHSETDGMPVMRAWSPSEEAAKATLADLRSGDPTADKTTYWVLQLTRHEVAQFKASGFIPEDA